MFFQKKLIFAVFPTTAICYQWINTHTFHFLDQNFQINLLFLSPTSLITTPAVGNSWACCQSNGAWGTGVWTHGPACHWCSWARGHTRVRCGSTDTLGKRPSSRFQNASFEVILKYASLSLCSDPDMYILYNYNIYLYCVYSELRTEEETWG